jgi:hypothetical protein
MQAKAGHEHLDPPGATSDKELVHTLRKALGFYIVSTRDLSRNLHGESDQAYPSIPRRELRP